MKFRSFQQIWRGKPSQAYNADCCEEKEEASSDHSQRIAQPILDNKQKQQEQLKCKSSGSQSTIEP